MQIIKTIGEAAQLYFSQLNAIEAFLLVASLLIAVLFLSTLVLFAKKIAKQKENDLKAEQKHNADLSKSLDITAQRLVEAELLADQLPELKSMLAVARREAEVTQKSFDTANIKLEDLGDKYHAKSVAYSGLQERMQAENRATQEKIELLNNNKQQLTENFEILANKIFQEKSEHFTRSSDKQLQSTLAPLKNQLTDFRKRIDDVYTTEAKERHSLQEQIKLLRADSLKISEDAANLTNALKFDNKAQGNWGELTLIRALEMCGLREPEEYETQISYPDADNKNQIPDVIVHLPGGRDIIIDSKVSLLAYSKYFETEDEESRALALEEHTRSVQRHVKQLSDKAYQNISGIATLDYVMLYIPVEGASALALQNHQNLWEEAYAKNIVLVSPTNLLAILRSVETIWRHEKQNKNAEEIARQAGNLHDKFVGLIKSLDAVGKGLESAQRSYDTAYNQLKTGKGNLISRVQNLEKLGAKTRQKLPQHLQTTSEDSDVKKIEYDEIDGITSDSETSETID